MHAERFYQYVIASFAQPPTQRHRALVQLHQHVLRDYLTALARISASEASQPTVIGSDQRTLADVVAHIAAWERFGIIAAGDILLGLDHPRSVTDVRGFIDTDGQTRDFADVHAFNAYQQQQSASLPWSQIQRDAIRTASTLYALFASPDLLTAERLEHTKPHRKRLRNGVLLDDTTMGWCLWVIYLDHEAVEHAVELQLPEDVPGLRR